jgi:predicted PhzF superfamily epimerase YddE/YHI9
MPELHVLRVFCNEDGAGGNPLGVFLEGEEIPPARRQAVAADLGFSETVFVDDAATGAIRIHTPTVELPFAGHPTVGAAWLLAREHGDAPPLRTPAGVVQTSVDGDAATVTAEVEWAPPFEWEQLGSAAEVEALAGPLDERGIVGYWAWLDEPAGVVRARVFPVRYGIDEDEATGAAGLRLCGLLGRPLEIRQGAGSLIRVRPGPGVSVELRGRVTLDEVRRYQGAPTP